MKLGTRSKVLRAAARRKIWRLLGLRTDAYPPRPAGTKLSPSQGLITATDETPRNSGLDTACITEWQTKGRNRLAQMAGYKQSTKSPELVAVRGPTGVPSNDQDLIRTTYYLRVRPDADVPVTTVINRKLSGPLPVFLLLTGSTSGVHLGWGEAKLPIDHQRLSIGADLARQAAQRGYLAVCIEQIGYGEREERHLPKKSNDRTIDAAMHAALLGQSLQGLKAMDVSATINWLNSSDTPYHVDKKRIFLFGHSSGGTTAQYAAALDPRICGVLASGSVRRMSEILATRGNGNGELLIPGFLTEFEADDVVALIAPRPFVGLSGISDHIYPFNGAERVVEGARPAFAALDASKKLIAVCAPHGHRYYAEESWAAWKAVIDPDCGDDQP